MLLSVATPPALSDVYVPASEVDVPMETLSEQEARLKGEAAAAGVRAQALLDVAAQDGAARGVRGRRECCMCVVAAGLRAGGRRGAARARAHARTAAA